MIKEALFNPIAFLIATEFCQVIALEFLLQEGGLKLREVMTPVNVLSPK